MYQCYVLFSQVFINPSSQGSGNSAEEGARKTVRAHDMEDTPDTRPSQHRRIHAHRNLREAMEAGTGSQS